MSRSGDSVLNQNYLLLPVLIGYSNLWHHPALEATGSYNLTGLFRSVFYMFNVDYNWGLLPWKHQVAREVHALHSEESTEDIQKAKADRRAPSWSEQFVLKQSRSFVFLRNSWDESEKDPVWES